MAQISISEEHFASLAQIARERGVSPDQLVETVIEQLEAEDQVAFWGPNIVEELQQAQQAYDQIQHHEYLTGEEFLAKLNAPTDDTHTIFK